MVLGHSLLTKLFADWFWGIHLLQRLRVPPGFPRLPRMPVVMLLQLGAPTLCLRKRTPQSHLLRGGHRVCLLADFVCGKRSEVTMGNDVATIGTAVKLYPSTRQTDQRYGLTGADAQTLPGTCCHYRSVLR